MAAVHVGHQALQRETITPESAGLTGADLAAPGWRRSVNGSGWRFRGHDGCAVSGTDRARCLSLAIPPAWRKVWINPDPKGHIQVAGQDAAGRTQYIYHPDWNAAAQAAKYADLLRFADVLPALRGRVKSALAARDDEHLFALAAIVRLIDVAGLRIGHKRYRALSGAVGATTLKSKHVRVSGGRLKLAFPSKSGQFQTVEVEDGELADALESLCGSPGADVFRADGKCISSADVNAFIRSSTGAPFTAKDFRTWGGSVAAAAALRRRPDAGVGHIVEAAADWLGNTPAIARASYIHPAILKAAGEDTPDFRKDGPVRLRADERVCYGLIRRATDS
jgi:DNA topoisomerase I